MSQLDLQNVSLFPISQSAGPILYPAQPQRASFPILHLLPTPPPSPTVLQASKIKNYLLCYSFISLSKNQFRPFNSIYFFFFCCLTLPLSGQSWCLLDIVATKSQNSGRGSLLVFRYSLPNSLCLYTWCLLWLFILFYFFDFYFYGVPLLREERKKYHTRKS